MRRTMFGPALAVVLAGFVAGCCRTDRPCSCPPPWNEHTAEYEWMVESALDTGVHAAIIAGRTLQPYHFAPGCEKLTEPAMHDLAVLAWHFRQCPGVLAVRRGDVSEALYARRLEAVTRVLADLHVPPNTVRLVDRAPEAPATATLDAVRLLQSEPPLTFPPLVPRPYVVDQPVPGGGLDMPRNLAP